MRSRNWHPLAIVMASLLLFVGCGELTSKDDPSGSGSATGRILGVDGSTATPAVFMVAPSGERRATWAAADGSFEFDNVAAGEYSLVVNDLRGNGLAETVAINADGDNDFGSYSMGVLEEYPAVVDLRGVAYEEKLTDILGGLSRLRFPPDGDTVYAWHTTDWIPDSGSEILRIDPETGEHEVFIADDREHPVTTIGIAQGLSLTPDDRYMLIDRMHDSYNADGELIQAYMPYLVTRDMQTGREIVLEVSNGTYRGFRIKSAVRHILNPNSGSPTIPYLKTGASYRDGRMDMLCQESDTWQEGGTWETPVAREMVLVSCDLTAEPDADGFCQTTVHEITGPEHDYGFRDYAWTDTHLLVVRNWGDVYSMDRATGEQRMIERVENPLTDCQDTWCLREFEFHFIDDAVMDITADRSGHAYYLAVPQDTWTALDQTLQRVDLASGAVETILDLDAHPDLSTGLEGMNLGKVPLLAPRVGSALAASDDGRYVAFAMRMTDGLHLFRLTIATGAITDSGPLSWVELEKGLVDFCAGWPIGQTSDQMRTGRCESGLLRSLSFDTDGTLRALIVGYPLGPHFVQVTLGAEQTEAVVKKFSSSGMNALLDDMPVTHDNSGRLIARAVDEQNGFRQFFALDPHGGEPIALTFLSADHGFEGYHPPYLDLANEYMYYLTRDPESGHEQLYRVDVDQILGMWDGGPAL